VRSTPLPSRTPPSKQLYHLFIEPVVFVFSSFVISCFSPPISPPPSSSYASPASLYTPSFSPIKSPVSLHSSSLPSPLQPLVSLSSLSFPLFVDFLFSLPSFLWRIRVEQWGGGGRGYSSQRWEGDWNEPDEQQPVFSSPFTSKVTEEKCSSRFTRFSPTQYSALCRPLDSHSLKTRRAAGRSRKSSKRGAGSSCSVSLHHHFTMSTHGVPFGSPSQSATKRRPSRRLQAEGEGESSVRPSHLLPSIITFLPPQPLPQETSRLDQSDQRLTLHSLVETARSLCRIQR
jgi:hypothetical protein